jgi:hypothetical protein
MNMSTYEITCPHCDTAFKLDEAGYADIVSQVRTAEFDAELHKQLEAAEKAKKTEIKLAEAEATKKAEAELAKQNLEIEKLKSEIKNAGTKQELEVTKALAASEHKTAQLENALKLAEQQAKLEANTIKEKLEEQVRLRDEEIQRWKDFRSKDSTNRMGLNLEDYCQDEFNKIRAGAFPKAYFEKDTEVKNGTKGDFIFRDYEDGTEFISIMFDMKNEAESTESKKKNKEFFKALDKNRNDKDCEYAVLVSRLEADSDYYNAGIVDVSHEYEKMYVVRPQFFIPLIILLRNAAKNTIETKTQLAVYEKQNLDLVAFKKKVSTVQESLANTYRLASERYSDAIDDIDKAIKALQATRENLLKSEGHLKNGVKKGEDLSIENLTKGNKTMKQKFEDLPEEDKEK